MATETNDGRIQKMEVDYTASVDEKIPQCEALAKVYCYKITFFCNICTYVLETAVCVSVSVTQCTNYR